MSGSQTETIFFNQIPNPPFLVPGTFVEVAPNYTNLGLLPRPCRALIIAQKITGASAVVNTIYNITRPIQATGLFGAGSEGEIAAKAFLAATPWVPLDMIAMADPGGGTKASFAVAITGPSTAAGQQAVDVAGQRITFADGSGVTSAAWAADLATAMNAVPGLPCSASLTIVTIGSTSTVTVTAKNAGVNGNDISIVPSPAMGDVNVPGLTITVTPTVGTGTPNVAGAIAAIGNIWYTGIGCQTQDPSTLLALHAEADRRFNAMTRKDCKVYTCFTGSQGTMLASAAPNASNSQYIYAPGLTKPGSMPAAIMGSTMGGAEYQLLQDPSRQLRNLPLPGIVGPQRADVYDDVEREALLGGGVSTVTTSSARTVKLDRLVSTRSLDSQGNPDDTWLDIMEIAVASAIRYDWRVFQDRVYPNNKMAPDNSVAAQYDPTIVTPSRLKGSWAGRLKLYAQAGWIINEQDDARSAVFQIDPNDRNRMDAVLNYTRIGNMIVDAARLQFTVI